MPQIKAPQQNSQPMGFSGRREATRAPTVENAKITTERHAVTKADEVSSLSEARRKAKAIATKVDTQAGHASQEAARVLIPPTLRSRPFVPSVTTLLYSTTVSRALQVSVSETFADSIISGASDVCLHP